MCVRTPILGRDVCAEAQDCILDCVLGYSLSRPFGTGPFCQTLPRTDVRDSRPGLLSAVPSGLIFASRALTQILKPVVISIVYSPTKQAAEKHTQRRARV